MSEFLDIGSARFPLRSVARDSVHSGVFYHIDNFMNPAGTYIIDSAVQLALLEELDS